MNPLFEEPTAPEGPQVRAESPFSEMVERFEWRGWSPTIVCSVLRVIVSAFELDPRAAGWADQDAVFYTIVEALLAKRPTPAQWNTASREHFADGTGHADFYQDVRDVIASVFAARAGRRHDLGQNRRAPRPSSLGSDVLSADFRRYLDGLKSEYFGDGNW